MIEEKYIDKMMNLQNELRQSSQLSKLLKKPKLRINKLTEERKIIPIQVF